MTQFLIFLLHTIAISTYVCNASRVLTNQEELSLSTRFEEWIAKYKPVYKDEAEEEHRFKIFKDNVEYIESMNKAGNGKYTLGLTKFSDRTKEEFKLYGGGYKRRDSSLPETNDVRFNLSNMNIPSSMDWNQLGAVTSIKNQNPCECCWIFSAVAAIEGINYIRNKKLVPLSEQQLLNCIQPNDPSGCYRLGDAQESYQYVMTNGGITSEENLPFIKTQESCTTNLSAVATISNFVRLPVNDEEAMLAAVASQPVSAAVDSSGLQHYVSGIVRHELCGTSLDHEVTVIGYGIESGTKFWLVKNSWGEDWGESGFAKIERSSGAAEGTCGIAMEVMYPTI